MKSKAMLGESQNTIGALRHVCAWDMGHWLCLEIIICSENLYFRKYKWNMSEVRS